MIFSPAALAPSGSATHSLRTPERSLAGFEARAIELSPLLEPGSEALKVAVVVLCARSFDFNTYRIAWFTGYPREFVARCARRLFDSGAWPREDSDEVWDEAGPGAEAFMEDVNVAAGQVTRRTESTPIPEWSSPANHWTSFDSEREESGEEGRFGAPFASVEAKLDDTQIRVEGLPPRVPHGSASRVPDFGTAGSSAVSEVAAGRATAGVGSSCGSSLVPAPNASLRSPAAHVIGVDADRPEAFWLS